ncbi:hypothetical protein J2X06_000330 [Lysobacter niastensis]|uniref:Thioredoxin domain-containing protein n=1 Tax=Lysobacter niastensis TaxID=380629 RepID=A0ABU1W6E8_9GAMM|nr:hypothetical protein [Lysobacter niastensis]MDR7133146.1 hypothetical protein [Lysobacter niastensis]
MNAPHIEHHPDRVRNRTLLLVLLVLFFGSMLAAGLLRFSGWRPASMKNHGELLQPPGDLRQVTIRQVDGGQYTWNPAKRTWRIALAPPAGCGSECDHLAREINTVWQLFGKDANDVDVLWICPQAQASCDLPAGAARPTTLHLLQSSHELRASLPRVEDPRGVPVYVIDPYGFVILRYPPGFDPSGLRTDLARLLKLK